MSHYFVNDPTLETKPQLIKYAILDRTFSLKTDVGVFCKDRIDEGTFAFLKALIPLHLAGRVLDVGCGYGALGLTLAAFEPKTRFYLIDVNARAIALCAENQKTLGLTNVETFISDIYQNVTGKYDSIVTNPPIRAGKKVIYAMFDGAWDYLVDGGSLFIVIRKSLGAPSASAHIAKVFGNCTLLTREKGYYIYQAVKKTRTEQ